MILPILLKKFVNIFLIQPLYICGGVGLENSFLNAIGLELQNQNNVMFISAERFMYHFIKSIKRMTW